jgi:D-hexose-6-phosphate mutarotase
MGDDDYKKFICVEAAQNSRRIHIGRDETWTATHVVTLAQH